MPRNPDQPEKKTGFWYDELATPYYLLAEKGVDITIASPDGGYPPIDPNSKTPEYETEKTKLFDQDKAAMKKLSETVKLNSVKADDFDAVYYPGGHGLDWDLASNTDSINLIQNFLAQNKPVATVCHGSRVLTGAKDQSGQPIVKGKQVTGFSNAEEELTVMASFVKVKVEDQLTDLGGLYTKADKLWEPYSVQDGLLITGQNPASSKQVAEKLFAKLSAS